MNCFDDDATPHSTLHPVLAFPDATPDSQPELANPGYLLGQSTDGAERTDGLNSTSYEELHAILSQPTDTSWHSQSTDARW